MKKLSLAATAFALVALAGCDRGNEDRIDAVDANAASSADLNELANDAANLASEAEALENQAEQLNQEAQALDNAAGAETPYDENIAGM